MSNRLKNPPEQMQPATAERQHNETAAASAEISRPPGPALQAAVVAVPGLPAPLSYSVSSAGPLRTFSKSTPLHRTFGSQQAAVGSEVTIEVGSRTTIGWVIELADLAAARSDLFKQRKISAPQTAQLQLLSDSAEDLRLKPVLSAAPAFDPDQLPLFRWMAEYYGVPIADVIENAIPSRSETKPRPAYRLSPAGRDLVGSAELAAQLKKKARLRAELLQELAAADLPLSSADFTASKNPAAALRRMAQEGLIELEPIRADLFRNPTAHPHALAGSADIPQQLTAGQQQALALIRHSISTGKFDPILLFGVTGSGKTEVYLRAIADVLAAGGSALVIVPEIALTPQLFDRFSSRLAVPLGLLHSQVGSTVRWNTWEALLDGRLRIALGARSAVFAPLKNLSLVIVDEEHESSYKQSDGLRYHARDVAVMRAKFAGCPVILGSATPSFESLLNVQKRRYQVVEMMERATARPVPSIEVVDLKSIKRKEMPSANISPQLHQALSETLARSGQAVIMYNKRGFASYLQCGSCNEVVSCPNCSVPLTYHRKRGKLLCHYCNLTMPVIRLCPICRDPRMTRDEREEAEQAAAASGPDFAPSTIGLPPPAQTTADPAAAESKSEPAEFAAGRAGPKDVGVLFHRGAGTERVVDELAELFPAAKIIRMDRDTVTHKNAYREILGKMRSGEADILVGTQMIAKGHDLPGVTLVGIIDADVGLHLPDFRASEKAFQLITQAAGRAGRGQEPGRVIVQTREAAHPTIVATVTGRFKAFARYELDYRTALNYPPSGRLLRLIISATRPAAAAQAAAEAARAAGEFVQRRVDQLDPAPRVSILGPAIAPLEKLLTRYRWHLLIKSSSAKLLSGLAADLNSWARTADLSDGSRVSIDVDPYEML